MSPDHEKHKDQKTQWESVEHGTGHLMEQAGLDEPRPFVGDGV